MGFTGRSSRPRGFTLLELLVVVGIIAVLVAILVPVLNKVQKAAMRTSAVSELHSIRTGLQQYYADFNMYPASSPGYNFSASNYPGPEMLAEGLVGYLPSNLDGGDPGFRVRPAAMGGRTYGPYVATDANNYVRETTGGKEYFIDPWGPRVPPPNSNSGVPAMGSLLTHKILYFRSTRSLPGTTLSTATTIFGDSNSTNSLFTYTDNVPYSPADFSNVRPIPAISSSDTQAKATDSRIAFLRMINPNAPALSYNSSQSALAALNQVNGPIPGATNFLLISAGPDGRPVQGFANTPEKNNWTGYFDSDDVIMTNDN